MSDAPLYHMFVGGEHVPSASGKTFEVEDPKGNKVFKRSFKTSEYGVAAVDFQLADEVNAGDYQLRAVLGDVKAEKTVQVKRYVLPKFKVEVKADKAFYLPKETVKAEIQGDTVVVSSEKVPDPVAVRYGWVNFAKPELNFFNKAGLPAIPFRTDALPLTTAPKADAKK